VTALESDAPRSRYRVAIIGGGPAGCACALALAGAGVEDVVIIEAGDYSAFCIGESVPPETMGLLRALGLEAAFLQEGHLPCYGSCSYWGSDKRGYNDTLLNPQGHGWHLDRSRFNRFLALQAQGMGVQLLCKTRLTGSAPVPMAQAGQGFMLELHCTGPQAGGQEARLALHADFVFDASGAHAVFARQRGSSRQQHLPLVCLAARFTLPGGENQGLTHLEAIEHGWWYGAHLPGNQLMLALYTDAATVKHLRLQQSEHWMALLAVSPISAALLPPGAVLRAGVQSFAVPAYCLDRIAGQHWMAIGDAAACWDPVTSQGIIKAMANGLTAAKAYGEPDAFAAMGQYEREVKVLYQRYLALHAQTYQMEQRWPHAAFWQRQHGR
jgi:flavin-dependent dehydrogenase